MERKNSWLKVCKALIFFITLTFSCKPQKETKLNDRAITLLYEFMNDVELVSKEEVFGDSLYLRLNSFRLPPITPNTVITLGLYYPQLQDPLPNPPSLKGWMPKLPEDLQFDLKQRKGWEFYNDSVEVNFYMNENDSLFAIMWFRGKEFHFEEYDEKKLMEE
jgi:hypothetical protein